MKLLSFVFLLALVSCNTPENCEKIAKLPKEQQAQFKDVNCSPNAETPTAESPTENDDVVTEKPSDEVSSGDLADADVPNEAFLFDANISLNNFGVSDEEKVTKAIEIIKTIIRSREFKDKVLNFSYKGQNKFVDTDLANEEVYLKLLAGQEDLKPEMDHEMDLDLELYYKANSTVGYTYPDGLRIWMNKKFFNQYTPAEVAGNIFHEWTHKLGFEHAFRYSVSRDSSVPYALGYLIEEMGKQYE